MFFTPRRQYPAWLYPGSGDRDPDACPRLESTRAILDPLRPWRWRRGRREAVAARADVWIVPYWTWVWAGWWNTLLSERKRPPVVAVVHNPVDHEKRVLQRLAARRILGRCQALFTHADVLKGTLQQKFPEIPTASHAIPPPPDFEVPDTAVSRSERDLPSEARIALFLGLIRPYKGVDLLLEAWHRLPAGCNWHLVVAGEPWGDQGKRLRRQVDRLGIGARVRLELRWIPEREVGSWLAAADLVVLPYRSGSQSAVAPLALGAGRPVVASRVGGLPEVVHHGVNGLLVEPGSVDALARVFAELDDAQLAELTRGARDWRGTITWESYAESIETLIERVVGA
jgi:glycosyltransferase involved in cell wall biosynthesis